MLFPWIEPLVEKLNIAMFDKQTLSYYKRLFDSVIKSKKAAGDKAVSVIVDDFGMYVHLANSVDKIIKTRFQARNKDSNNVTASLQLR